MYVYIASLRCGFSYDLSSLIISIWSHRPYSYVELSKKSEPNKSFLNFTCSETDLKEPYKSFVEMTCSDVSDEGAVWQISTAIDKAVAESIVREFRMHATKFDMLYDGRLPEEKSGK